MPLREREKVQEVLREVISLPVLMCFRQIVGSISLFCLIESIGICYIFVVTFTEYLLSSFTSKTDFEKNDYNHAPS